MRRNYDPLGRIDVVVVMLSFRTIDKSVVRTIFNGFVPNGISLFSMGLNVWGL